MMTGKAPCPIPDMTGQTFGRWTVLSRDGSNARGDSLWLCRCECGEERAVTGGSLRQGKSTSCGCLTNVRYSTDPEKVAERFWDQVDLFGPDGCWLWTGLTIYSGYGLFYTGRDQAKRRVMAHRWAYERVVRSIPEGLELDHLCSVRNCVNPDHLEPVTHDENIRRGVEARRSGG